MRSILRAALAVTVASGAASAQVQVRPLPAQVAPPVVGRPVARVAPVEYTGPTAFQKAINTSLVVAGTVSVGKETVEAEQWKGQPLKTTHRVASIKVTDTFVGAKADTIRVLMPPADPTYPNDPFPGQPYVAPFVNSVQFIDGQEGVFFLTPHPTVAGAFMPAQGNPPLNPLDTNYKADLAEVKGVAAVHADPLKALKAEKPEDRIRAAFVLVNKYRQPPAFDGKKYEETPIPAEETKLIFQALLEADWDEWDKPRLGGEIVDWTRSPSNVIGRLQLYTGAPGVKNFPQVQPQPGQGYHAAMRDALKKWREGDGKDYQIKRFVHPGEKK
ncbi:MAG: hypothetical protein MUF18_13000 [Fimbriiglobus sp.]|jgi:hypothetical protein|nr:hypothetical protein [Fimbriiglobus sp.]